MGAENQSKILEAFKHRDPILKHKVGNSMKNESIQDIGLPEQIPESPFLEKPSKRDVGEVSKYDYMFPEVETIQDLKITVIIPTLNEAKNIEAIIREIRGLGFHDILIIDGNSQDETTEIARTLGVNVLNQDGKGKGMALRQAFSYDGLGDWVIIMDADGSMKPGELSAYIHSLKDGADVVKGSRFMPGGHSEDMTFFRRIGNGFFVFLVNNIFEAKFTDLCYGYAAFKRDALQKLNPHLKSKSFEIETELFVKAKKLGLRVAEVPSVELQRRNGQSNLNAFRDGFKILRTILREAFKD
jgi:glycosyltransferase involved in cell wall biosynthesis